MHALSFSVQESAGTPWHRLVGKVRVRCAARTETPLKRKLSPAPAQTLDLAEQLVGAELLEIVLNSPVAKVVLTCPGASPEWQPAELGALVAHLRTTATQYVGQSIAAGEEEDTYVDDEDVCPPSHLALHVVWLAAACVQLFMQTNWTGPELDPRQEHALQTMPMFAPWVAKHASVLLEPPAAVEAFTPLGSTSLSSAVVAPAASDAGRKSTGATAPPDTKSAENIRQRAIRALHSACVTGLAVDGMDAYDLLSTPQVLLVARALLTAVAPLECCIPSLPQGLQSAVRADLPPPPSSGSPRVHPLLLPPLTPEQADCVAACKASLSAHWWSLRLAAVHQQSLVDQAPSGTLLSAALTHACLAGTTLGMDHPQLGAFVPGDSWNKDLVKEVLASTATRVDDTAAAGAGDATARQAVDAMSSGLDQLGPEAAFRRRRLWSRLLLEWGQVQVHGGRLGAAKTTFFVAKGVSGLWTHLTGALGRRTKYQKFDVSQLVLRAASLPAPPGLQALDHSVSAPALGAGNVAAQDEPGAVAPQATAEEDAPTKPPAAAPEGTTAASAAGGAAVAGTAPAEEGQGGTGEEDPGSAAAVSRRIVDAGTVNRLGIADVQLDGLDEDNILLEKMDLAEDRGEAAPAQRVFPPWYDGEWAAAHSIEAPVEGPPRAPEAPAQPAMEGFLASTADGHVSTLDQAILCALCLDIKNNNPDDGLTQEEMRSYTARVLAAPQNWMVYSTALLTKSWLEYANHRTLERALLQMQVLVDQYSNRLTPLQFSQRVIDESAPAWDRLRYMHALVFPARWALKRQLADRYKAMHVVRSALGLYQELELWDEVIDCYIMLEKPKRAKALLEERLAIAPTPRLLCRYGQVTDTDQPYVDAWELSQGTYAAAQLSLARRYYNREEWDASAAAFAKGTALSRHNDADFMTLGTVHMRRMDMPAAISAFTRVVSLTPDHGIAWANMGGCLVHLERYREAYEALVQASKYRRTDWKVWHNLMRVSLVTRAYFKAIAAMKHMANLVHQDPSRQNQGVDEKLLKYLVAVVSEDVQRHRSELAAEPATPSSTQPEEAARADTTSSTPREEGGGGEDDDGAVLPTLPAGLDDEEEVEPGADGDDILRSLGTDGLLHARLSTRPAAAPVDETLPVTARDMLHNRAHLYQGSVFRLLQHLTGALPNRAEVWHIFEMFERARGRDAEALECLQKHVRALMSGSWDRHKEQVEAACTASKRLVAALHEEGSAASISSAVMHVRNLVARLDARKAFHDLPVVTELQAMTAPIEEAYAALRSGGAGGGGGSAAE